MGEKFIVRVKVRVKNAGLINKNLPYRRTQKLLRIGSIDNFLANSSY